MPIINVVRSAASGGSDSVGNTHKDVLAYLSRQFEPMADPSRQVRLVALIFGRPELKMVREELIPHLSHWNCRSSNHVDFFCIGFSASGHFEPEAFDKALRQFEKETSWRYTGGTDLILLNAKYVASKRHARFDFSSAVVLTLESAVATGAIANVPIFFESIISRAEQSDGSDPTWNVSDDQGARLVRRAIATLLLALLPKDIRAEVRQAFAFVVKDITRRQH